MNKVIILTALTTILFPSVVAKEEVQSPEPTAVVTPLTAEMEVEYLPAVTVTTNPSEIEIISSDTHFVSSIGIQQRR